MKQIISFALLLSCGFASGQLYVENDAGIFIGSGSYIFVQGNVTASQGILGDGWLIMDGEEMQTINMNGHSISNLEIKTPHGIELGGNISILESLQLSAGNIKLGNYNLEILDLSKVVNSGTFGIESSARGVIRVKVNDDFNGFFIPYVSRGIYTPLVFSSMGRYHNAHFEISSGPFRGNIPKDISKHVNYSWRVKRHGIDGIVEIGIDILRFATAYASGVSLSLYSKNGSEWNLVDGVNAVRSFKKGTVGPLGAEFMLMKGKANDLSFSLSPNPANDFTRVSILAPATGRAVVTITDLRGNIVRATAVQLFRGDNIFQLDVAGLANGTYYVLLSHKGHTSAIRLIKD